MLKLKLSYLGDPSIPKVLGWLGTPIPYFLCQFVCYLSRHATHFYFHCFRSFFFFIHFHFYSPEQNPNPSPSAVVVINGRVLLIELPTNSVFMRLRRVHFAGLGIAVAVGFPFLSIPFHSFCSVLFRRLFGIGCGFRFGFGFGFGGVTQQGSQQIEMLPPGRQEIVFNLPLRLFSGT